jgi:hypothetical protein
MNCSSEKQDIYEEPSHEKTTEIILNIYTNYAT